MELKKVIRLIPSKENHFAKLDKSIPNEPGIYLLFDKDLELIYVGKARNIRHRIREHTSKEISKRLRYDNLDEFEEANSYVSFLNPEEIAYYSCIFVEEERERIVYEMILISILKPKYNFLSKSEQLEYFKERIAREKDDN